MAQGDGKLGLGEILNSLSDTELRNTIDWHCLFAPDSVALVGASNIPAVCDIMWHLLASAKRKTYLVNPSVSEVLGIAAYGSVLDIPSSVDLAVIIASAPQVPVVLQECAKKGAKAAVIISGGFAEMGEQDSKLETELTKIAQQEGIRFIGPNSIGHADTSSQLSTLPWIGEITPGSVAFISQSGSYAYRIICNGISSGIGFSKLISTGNEADLHLEDYLEYLAQDENTEVIIAYIEELREGRRFFQLAKETTVSKPIIVIKAGGAKESARVVRSCELLASSDAVYTAAFRQAGVIRVDDDDELCDVVTALLNQPLPRGNRIGILTNGGGPGVMAVEACRREGLEIAPLASSTMEKLDACLPPRWSHGNPIDTAGVSLADSPAIFSSLGVLMEDDNIDAILLQVPVVLDTEGLSNIFNAGEIEAFKETEERSLSLLRQWIKEYGKPVVLVNQALEFATGRETTSFLHKEGIPFYPNLRRAVRVLRHLAWYRGYLDIASHCLGQVRFASNRLAPPVERPEVGADP